MNTEQPVVEKSLPIPFRLCMANVLISACQKIPESAKKTFARKALPPLVHSLKVLSIPYTVTLILDLVKSVFILFRFHQNS